MKTICVIPTYNCANQVTRVLGKLKATDWRRFDAIWVIDNGSHDGTAEVAKELIHKVGLANASVFRNSRNVNLGGTHKVAFREARKLGATHVLILHGDDQADAAESHNLLDLSLANGEITILGSRFMKGSQLKGYNLGRILGNRLLNMVYSTFTLKWLSDLGSGLNLFALKDIEDSQIQYFGNSLSFNYELILFLVGQKRRFIYTPISWAEEDQVSNARNFNIFFKALGILGTWIIFRGKSDRGASASDVSLVEV